MKPEVKVGLTILAAILGLYLTITWVRSMHLFTTAQNTYEISVNNVNGLLEGDPVTVRGYLAGKVMSITPGKDDVRIQVLLDKSIPIFQDATAEIQVKELMGNKQVEISPGGKGPTLENGGFIAGQLGMDLTSTFKVVGEMADIVEPSQIQSLVASVDSLSKKITGLVDGIPPEDVKEIVANLKTTTNSLTSMLNEAERRNFIARVDKAFKKVEDSFGRVDRLMTLGETSLNNINKLTSTFNAESLPKTHKLMDEADAFLDNTGDVVKALDDITTSLNSRKTVVGKLIHDEAMAQDLDQTLDRVDSLLLQLKNEPLKIRLEGLGKTKETRKAEKAAKKAEKAAKK